MDKSIKDIEIPYNLINGGSKRNKSKDIVKKKKDNVKLSSDSNTYSVYEKKIKNLKKEIKACDKTIFHLKLVIFGLIITIAALSTIFSFKYKKLLDQYNSLKETSRVTMSELIDIKDSLTDIDNILDSESDLLLKTSQIIVAQDKDIERLKADNLELQETNNSLVSSISVYEKRKELFDKHQNAVLSSTGARTDITYDDMQMLENLTNDLNMTDDSVSLIYALVRHESDGNQNAVNPKSSATGLGQFLSSTGQFVYTKLMRGSGYQHSVTAKDHTTNLKMMAYYLDYLDKNHSSITGVLNEYRGYHDPKYLAEVDSILKKYNGITLASIKIHN